VSENDGRFSIVQRVRFGDLDAMQHLNNVEFLRFFETARIDWFREVIPDHTPTRRRSFGFIFAECHIAYRAPAFFGDEIRTWITPAEMRRAVSLQLGKEVVVNPDLINRIVRTVLEKCRNLVEAPAAQGGNRFKRIAEMLRCLEKVDRMEVLAAPARERVQPSDQLLHREWFHQVVVGARLEPADPVSDRVARGQHQDRRGEPLVVAVVAAGWGDFVGCVAG